MAAGLAAAGRLRLAHARRQPKGQAQTTREMFAVDSCSFQFAFNVSRNM